MMLCLLGALALPPSASWYKWVGMALGSLIVGLPFLRRAAHRSRIRHAVQETGGHVIHIRRLPFWKQDYWVSAIHEVRYADGAGVEHEAVCRSGFLYGVQWITVTLVDSRPPHP